MSSAPDQKSYVEVVLNEVLEEVSGLVLDGNESSVDFLHIAEDHGSGYLCGCAAANLDVASRQFGQDREYSLVSSAMFSILAVIADRIADAAAIQEEATPDSTTAKEDEADYFSALLAKIAAAQLKTAA